MARKGDFFIRLLTIWGLGTAPGYADWQTEWQNVSVAAKKEGQVHVYATSTQEPVLRAFQKAHPEIKVVGITGRSSDTTHRLFSERRANRFLADVAIHGATDIYGVYHMAHILDPIKPALLLPEVTDSSKWWQGKHRYVDPEGNYVFAFIGAANRGAIYYNTKIANPREFQSLWDFLRPKWRGKIVARDITSGGTGGGAMRFFYHHPDLGPKFIERLFTEMDVTLTRDHRSATDWLAHGKFPICFFCSDIRPLKAKGLPVETFGFMKEGAALVGQGGTIGLINPAPHPNAAKLFVNWFLSREGQMIAQQKSGLDSLRIDIPKDDVDLEVRRIEGIPYLDMNRPEVLDMRPIVSLVERVLSKKK